MLNKKSFTLACILALAISPPVSAEENSTAETIVTSTASEGMTPAQVAMPVAPIEQPDSKPVPALKPNNDSLFDYRYCLELKSDAEIAACAYKNR